MLDNTKLEIAKREALAAVALKEMKGTLGGRITKYHELPCAYCNGVVVGEEVGFRFGLDGTRPIHNVCNNKLVNREYGSARNLSGYYR